MIDLRSGGGKLRAEVRGTVFFTEILHRQLSQFAMGLNFLLGLYITNETTRSVLPSYFGLVLFFFVLPKLAIIGGNGLLASFPLKYFISSEDILSY